MYSYSLQEIYDAYWIPPQLQAHQIQVATVGLWVCDQAGLQGVELDRTSLRLALLLHDMGNLVKFRRPFLGEMGQRASLWEQRQDAWIQKYGKNAHNATEAIVAELGVSGAVQHIIFEMRDEHQNTVEGISPEGIIAEYADLCVTPNGIEGFSLRVQDLLTRYSIAKTDMKVKGWYAIQDWVEEKTHLSTSQLEVEIRDLQTTAQKTGAFLSDIRLEVHAKLG
ncbi:MAG: hypothetical protein UX04_C0005G0057 [Microgenomates group bacterium GW2011_GWF2_45_18]|nr:MAG: hypothetical protein UW18_C0007G0057 [Microgenomates group bacterium GW2011_GWF1_44_10]KKU01638.1 MAG: hypothetical protein UX04_C0005G0057 [Microgenomates group bacterium GW2011_GWF2_45_18]OGJ41303.1 MAG: hypothetical protein A2378_04325 [Candidatus Pacebacteria bacterium RIFOXYB1_FULL_44_10]HAU99480.1 hypothetical protein [Candidatus Paceibacterota bacterium]HAX01451.1 hypothetical protein [Candidatus Paceibacterota bacterium]